MLAPQFRGSRHLCELIRHDARVTGNDDVIVLASLPLLHQLGASSSQLDHKTHLPELKQS